MVKKAALATPNLRLRAARKERGWTQQKVADRIGAPHSLNISRWENGTAFPSTYYLEQLCHLFGKSVRELGFSQLEGEMQDETTSDGESEQSPPQAGPRMWTVPYPRNLFFLEREEVLTRLQRQFLATQAMDLSQPQAISGLGGIGKTQVVLEYAYRHAQDYQAVFWVRADSRDTLVADFLEIARTMKLPEREERDQTIMVAAVKSWLSQHTDWLMILANADELTLLPEFLPAPLRGHLLLTTRAQALGRLAYHIEVHALGQDEAALLVLRRAGLLAFDTALAQAERADQRAAEDLSLQLGGLPLALDQAGAYLEETGCSLQHYLNLYKSHRADLLRRRGGLILDHPDSVVTTLSLSFASVEQQSALAADVLRVCSLLHPDAIPEELFLQGAVHLGPPLAATGADPLAFNNALSVIQSYSLLRRSSSEQTLSIHQLVQAVLADAMTKQERDLWTERTIAALNTVFPQVRGEGWEQWGRCGRLLPHVLTVVAASTPLAHSLELASLLLRTADYLLQRTQYEQAEPLYLRALHIREQSLGREHPQVAFPWADWPISIKSKATTSKPKHSICALCVSGSRRPHKSILRSPFFSTIWLSSITNRATTSEPSNSCSGPCTSMSKCVAMNIAIPPHASTIWLSSILSRATTSGPSRSCSESCVSMNWHSGQSIPMSLSLSSTWPTSIASKAGTSRPNQSTCALCISGSRSLAASIPRSLFLSLGWQPCIENRATTSKRNPFTSTLLLFDTSSEETSIPKRLKRCMSSRACMNCRTSRSRHSSFEYGYWDWNTRIPSTPAHATPTSYECVGGQRKPML